ncbi:MAG: DUF418 domain-containing protein [Bacillota bacterium]|nr:DUF418 domain-containing protein [Bacillota bacterium]MDW7677030.1 DUF418 domain-containing protein [Bacillota bacterium]
MLVWWGDILILYALTALVIMLFLKWQARKLLAAGLSLLLIPTLVLLLYVGWFHGSGQKGYLDGGSACTHEEAYADYLVYSQGSFAEITHKRMRDFLTDYLGSDIHGNLFIRMVYASYYLQVAGLILGHYGTVGPVFLTKVVVPVYLLQMLMSTLWLKFFQQGPMEWMMRKWIYRKFIPHQ